MISVEQREKIRRAYFIEEKSIRRIAREFKCSRPTIRKAIASPEPPSYTLTAARPAPVLGPYKDQIKALLAENEQLPRKQRYTGRKIFQLIEKDATMAANRPFGATLRSYEGRGNDARCTFPSNSILVLTGRWTGERL